MTAATTVPGFTPTCRLHNDEPMLFNADDVALYERHMQRQHGAKAPGLAPEFRPLTNSTRYREYNPKPTDAGQPVGWTERENGVVSDRTGVIWSAGPEANSLWVIPDDATTEPVALKMRRGSWEVLASYPSSWQRDTIRRCENLRRHGSLYSVIDHRTLPSAWDRNGRNVTAWHADPDCSLAEGRTRSESDGAWHDKSRMVCELIDELLNRGQSWRTGNLCRRCVWLDDTAEEALING